VKQWHTSECEIPLPVGVADPEKGTTWFSVSFPLLGAYPAPEPFYSAARHRIRSRACNLLKRWNRVEQWDINASCLPEEKNRGKTCSGDSKPTTGDASGSRVRGPNWPATWCTTIIDRVEKNLKKGYLVAL
jgi:hypothetical protein